MELKKIIFDKLENLGYERTNIGTIYLEDAIETLYYERKKSDKRKMELKNKSDALVYFLSSQIEQNNEKRLVKNITTK